MKWSWKIARVAGIDIYIHITFLLLIAWIALSYYITQRNLAATINGVVFILALFLCILLHEFGHALMARKYHVPTRDITLLPIGGVARLDRMPEEPKEELFVSLAGPAVNLVIAGILFIWIILTSGLSSLNQLSLTSGSFVGRLMVTNAWLALFNLIPAFPMDGGRIVRALLGIRLEYTRATQIAAVLGQGIAILFGFIGLFTNPFLLFIALFVWIGAAQESSMVQMKSAISGIPVSRAMMTEFTVLSPQEPLGKVVELILSGSQHDYPVVNAGKVVGVLTRDDLIAGLSKFGEKGSVADAMSKDFTVVESVQMLEQVSDCLQNSKCRTMPVLRRGELVGLLTMDNIGELLMIRTALKSDRVQPLVPPKPFIQE
jgi:Zn-dependent protease